MYRKLFFSTSAAVADRLTETFDFVWATATAQWNLRWQVHGFIRAYPSASDDDLRARFAFGSGIRGANIRKACVELSWDAQQERFARVLLIEFCALYEAWIDGTLGATKQRTSARAKGLQYATSSDGGVGTALASLKSNISPELQDCVYPVLLTNKKNSLSHLEGLLRCYRYFKECRNGIVHHGGVSTQRLVDACGEYRCKSKSTLGVSELPEHFPVDKAGDMLSLSLRGVVGFGEVVLRLVTTLDAELSQTREAEVVFAHRWVHKHGQPIHLPKDIRAQETKIEKLVRQIGLEAPVVPLKLLPLLRRYSLVV